MRSQESPKFTNSREDVLKALGRIKSFNPAMWEIFIEIERRNAGHGPKFSSRLQFILLSKALDHTEVEKEQVMSMITSEKPLMSSSLSSIGEHGTAVALPNVSLAVMRGLRRLKYILEIVDDHDNIRYSPGVWLYNLAKDDVVKLLHEVTDYSAKFDEEFLYFDLRTLARVENDLPLY